MDSYTLTDSFTGEPLQAAIDTQLDTVLENGKELTVVSNAADTTSAELGSYSATVDADRKMIVVKAGTTTVAQISYQIKGQKQYLITDAGEVTYDFTQNILGLDTATAVPSTGLTSDDGCLTITGNGMKWHDGTHGAAITTGDGFALNIPAGQTTLTFSVCAYSKATAAISMQGSDKVETVSLTGDGADDTKTISYICKSETDTTVNIAITGNGYLHYIKANAESVRPVATVKGSIDGADGELLYFYDGTAKVAETTVENGAYSVSLPTGSQYRAAFADEDRFEVIQGATIDLSTAAAGAYYR